jgi:hypothetical protein
MTRETLAVVETRDHGGVGEKFAGGVKKTSSLETARCPEAHPPPTSTREAPRRQPCSTTRLVAAAHHVLPHPAATPPLARNACLLLACPLPAPKVPVPSPLLAPAAALP